MTEQSANIVNRSGVSAVWLIPFIAFVFVGWLMVKSAANQGVFITIEFDNANGIEIGQTEVRYKGLTAGKVTNVTVSDSLKSVLVEIEMIGSTSEALTDNTKFWFVTADVSLQGVKGLDTLISGSYINMEPDLTGKGKARRHFIGLTEQPPLDINTPGLHLKLIADTLGSIEKNSPITFKQLTVGYVSGYRYLQATNQVEIDVFIEPEFKQLVKTSSRFWNASGIAISGSISEGVNIRTQSLATIIAGGIAFDHDSQGFDLQNAKSGQRYTLHQDFNEAKLGFEIELQLPWNSGIEQGAAIVYQGIKIGRVDEVIDIDAQKRVLVTKAQVNPRLKPYLTEQAQFYVVSPSFDLTAGMNMGALLKGTHIGIILSEQGALSSTFAVLRKKPPLSHQEPGLHLTLKASQLKSISLGSGIFYKEQKVGNIQSLTPSGPDQFDIDIFIEPEFAHFVSTDSRFWHASGVKVSANLQGVKVETPALQALLSGGISFDSGVSDERTIPNDGDVFSLFPSMAIAEQRSELSLAFSSAQHDVKVGMSLIYQNVEVGSIHRIEQQENLSIATLGVLPQYQFLLKEGGQFFLVKPELSLAGISDTTALFGGAYISLYPGNGDAKDQFVLHHKAPKKPTSAQGLQLVLQAPHGGDINRHSKVTYRGIAIGQIDNVSLNAVDDVVDVHITINRDFQHLITPFTRFYNAGGVSVVGDLTQFNVKTETLDSLLKGGISFINPDLTEQQTDLDVSEGDSYALFANHKQAEQAGLPVSIYFENYADIKAGMRITHRGQQVGLIEKLIFDKNTLGVTAVGFLNDLGKRLAKHGSQFWLAQARVGLVGNKNVGHILSGGSIGMLPGTGELSQHFVALNYEPAVTTLHHGLNIQLKSDTLGSISVGNPVLYRQVKVGEVIGVALANTAEHVVIYINIPERYAPLVKSSSQFWNISGVKLKGGLFSGIAVETSSIETIISGGIAFATPPDESTQASEGTRFDLHKVVNDKWLEWQPQISLVTSH